LSLADPLAIASIALAVIATCFIVIYVMRKQRRSEKTVPEENLRVRAPSFPFRVAKSVPRQDASNAKGELRILDLERDPQGMKKEEFGQYRHFAEL